VRAATVIKIEREKIMKRYSISVKVLSFILILFGHTNLIYAEDSNAIPTMEILWQKEIAPESSFNYYLGPIAFNKTTGKLLLSMASFRPPGDSDGKIWLMEIDPDSGKVTKKTFMRDINKDKFVDAATACLITSMTVSKNDIILTGKFFNKSVSSIIKIDQQNNTSKYIELNDKKGKNVKINNIFSLDSENVLFVGRNREGKSLIIKADSEVDMLWEKNYLIGQGNKELISDGVAVGNDGGFAIIGWYMKGKFSDRSISVVDFISRHNKQGDIIAKDEFKGGATGGLGSLHEICQESSGNIIAVYEGGIGLPYSDVKIRAYTSDLKFLWEKRVVKSKEAKPSTFNITAKPRNGFIVAANVDFGNLRVYEYDKEGNQVANFSVDEEVRVGNLGLICMDKKAFVIFPTRTGYIGQTKKSRKINIKIIALELRKSKK